MYAAQHRYMTSKIDVFRMKLIYFILRLITHNNNVIEQNINVSMFDNLSVKEPHRFPSHHCSFLNNNNIKNLSSDQLPPKNRRGAKLKNL